MDAEKIITAAGQVDKTARVNIRINALEWEEFKAVCESRGVVMSSVLRALIRDFTETAKRGGE